jgi:hypothetical protein
MDKKTKQTIALLAYVASKREVITYTELADIVGGNPRRADLTLGPVAAYCRAEGRPPLWTLVVATTTGKSSDAEAQPGDQERCYAFPWKAALKGLKSAA